MLGQQEQTNCSGKLGCIVMLTLSSSTGQISWFEFPNYILFSDYVWAHILLMCDIAGSFQILIFCSRFQDVLFVSIFLPLMKLICQHFPWPLLCIWKTCIHFYSLKTSGRGTNLGGKMISVLSMSKVRCLRDMNGKLRKKMVVWLWSSGKSCMLKLWVWESNL